MTDDEKRAAFWTLKTQVDELEAAIKVMRDEYDAAVAAHRELMRPKLARIKLAEVPLYDLKQRMAALARELRGPDGIARTALAAQIVNRGT